MTYTPPLTWRCSTRNQLAELLLVSGRVDLQLVINEPPEVSGPPASFVLSLTTPHYEQVVYVAGKPTRRNVGRAVHGILTGTLVQDGRLEVPT